MTVLVRLAQSGFGTLMSFESIRYGRIWRFCADQVRTGQIWAARSPIFIPVLHDPNEAEKPSLVTDSSPCSSFARTYSRSPRREGFFYSLTRRATWS